MQLSGKQISEIEEALLDAFPARDELSRVLRIELDERLEAIADGANQRVVIFNLVSWAERTGKIDALLQGASRQNPGNPTLQKLMRNWRTTPPPEDAARPPAQPDDRPTTSNAPTDARGSQGAIFNASGPITQNFVGYSTDQHKTLDRPASIEPNESGKQPPPKKPYLSLLLITVVAGLLLTLGAYGLGYMLDPSVTPTPSSVSANPMTPQPQEVSAPQLIDWPTPTATETSTAELVATPTELPTSAPVVVVQQLPSPTDTPRPTSTDTPTNIPTPADVATRTNPQDDAVYVYVPAGPFIMGSSDDDPLARDIEKPQQSDLYLDAFWIMRTEVTNAQYARCIEAGVCSEPYGTRWNNPFLAEHPVSGVTLDQANEYARWVGGRLPTEAEWEKACRGTDGRIYPWGNEPPTDQLANYDGNVDDTTAVSTYPKGVSPYGVLDTAGNVWEWTNSLWGEDWRRPSYGYPYDANDGRENPAAPNSVYRVVRGGAYYSTAASVRCAARDAGDVVGLNGIGFRVVSPGF